MRVALTRAFVALSLALCGGASAEDARTIFVSSNGWHTDITLSRADLPEGRVPEGADFPDAAYLQFGWGDADYYTTPDPGIGTTLGAAFPGSAVVHLAGLSARPSAVFRDVEEIALTLDAAQFARLLGYLHESFERDGEPRAQSVAPGVYSFSRFYPATGEFHLFNTCNTWTARALATAGLDISPSGVQRAGDVMDQLRALKAE
jgi:uncharacterized protein (TIGR02117 family)